MNSPRFSLIGAISQCGRTTDVQFTGFASYCCKFTFSDVFYCCIRKVIGCLFQDAIVVVSAKFYLGIGWSCACAESPF